MPVSILLLLASMSSPSMGGVFEYGMDARLWTQIVQDASCVVTVQADVVSPGRAIRVVHTCGAWECVETWAEMDYLPGKRLGRQRSCFHGVWDDPEAALVNVPKVGP